MKKIRMKQVLLLAHKFYWMRKKLFTEEIHKNIFVLLLGPASNRMKTEKMRINLKIY